jgi:resuscitation-promoting factor RpfA
MPFPFTPGGVRSSGARSSGARSSGALSPGGMAVVALAGASLVAAAALASIFLSTAHNAWSAIAAAGPAFPADGILLVASLGGLLLSLWLGLGMTLTALSALPGAVGHASRRLAGRVAPAVVRKAVAFILGSTLTAALVPGSAAAGAGAAAPRPAVMAAAKDVMGAVKSTDDVAPDASFGYISDPVHGKDDGKGDMEAAPPPSWSPWSAARLPPPKGPPTPHPAPNALSVAEVVVHRGDTLWAIAARRLDPAATAADIEAECRRWFAVNREAIGDDANLILPGQLLRPPPSPPSGRASS